MKDTILVWVPKGISTKDVLRIVKDYGCHNDTLYYQEGIENPIPFEIKIIVKRVLTSKEKAQ